MTIITLSGAPLRMAVTADPDEVLNCTLPDIKAGVAVPPPAPTIATSNSER